jgi:DNA repair protein RecO (recombination protein O)
MTRPRSYQTEAVITRKTRLGEADHILTLYTPDLGKIQGVAKGVRRPKSKMAGHLELLTHSRIALARGRNLDTITGGQTIHGFLRIRESYELTACGLYVVDLVNRFTPEHVENPALFRLLVDTLQNLCEPDADPRLALRHFEVHLFGEAGYRPQLRECVSCHRALESEVNAFSASTGGALCPDCALEEPLSLSLSVNALKVLRFLQDSEVATVNRLKVDDALARELETITRRYISYLLEREVRSAAGLSPLPNHLQPSPSDVPGNDHLPPDE